MTDLNETPFGRSQHYIPAEAGVEIDVVYGFPLRDPYDSDTNEESRQDTGPRLEQVEIIEDGKAIGVLLREFDGSISAIRIAIEQLID